MSTIVGLVAEVAEAPKKPTRAQLIAEAEALGCDVASKATVPELKALIAEAKAAGAGDVDDTGDVEDNEE